MTTLAKPERPMESRLVWLARRMSLFSSIAFLACLFASASQHSSSEPPPLIPVRSATVEMQVRDNRVFVPLRVTGPNGTSRVVLFWVDSGGDTVFLSGRLARGLGLEGLGSSFQAMGETPAHFVTKPRIFIGDMAIDLTHASVGASLSESSIDAFAGIAAEGFLPATVLMNYDVVFDYPGHSFTLAEPGVLSHRGPPVRASVHPTTGFARIEMEVAGQTYGFMLDTGAAYTCVSRALLDHWIGVHPAWPHSVGAVGAANMVGKQFDVVNALVRVPEIKWGTFRLRDVGMVSRPAGVYEAVSKDMTAPVVGALGGNVLRQFRLELDYPSGTAYLIERRGKDSHDLDCVGLILQVRADGTVPVSGVAERDGRVEVDGVQPGDILLRVDGHDVTGASLATILRYLSGAIGENRRLTLRHGKQELTVSATVVPHPPSRP
jgi:predicted aspartyl protease